MLSADFKFSLKNSIKSNTVCFGYCINILLFR